MPTISSTMYVIAVKDLKRTAEFYKRAMGFTVREIGDDGWRMFVKDQCRIMAGHCPDAVPAGELGDHSYFAYLNVEEIDAYFAQVAQTIEQNGGKILKPPRDEPWGMREFALQTIDGHRIMLGHDLKGNSGNST